MFIGPERRLVRYDDLSQTPWTAGLTAVAGEENNPLVQGTCSYALASLFQVVCDYSFQACIGVHALVLTFFEESKITWKDLSAV